MGGNLGDVFELPLGVVLHFLDVMQQREDRRTTVWHTVIWPGEEMELHYCPFHSLGWREVRKEEGKKGGRRGGEKKKGDGGRGKKTE